MRPRRWSFALCSQPDAATTTRTTSTTSAVKSEQQSVDAAIKSCNDEAKQLGGAAGTALGSACTSVGNTATQVFNAGGEDVEQALSDAAGSCKNQVGQLPSGQAQDALSKPLRRDGDSGDPGAHRVEDRVDQLRAARASERRRLSARWSESVSTAPTTIMTTFTASKAKVLVTVDSSPIPAAPLDRPHDGIGFPACRSAVEA